MNEIQKVEFELLNNFIKVCEQLNISYFLVCGSALGAVKYNGFIPWDDDIDVALYRNDYEKFIKEAPKFLPDNLFVQNFHSDEFFPQIYSKLRNSDTAFIEKSVSDLDINHGVYIDFFPLDGYPENKFLCKMLEFRKKVYVNLLSTAFLPPENKIKFFLYKFKRLIRVHKHTRYIAGKYEKMISKYNTDNSDIICNHGNWQGKLDYSPKFYFDDGVNAQFEGLPVRVPKEYDKYLSKKYGDYMSDLPEEEKKGHHYYCVCDLDKSYKYYLKKGD